MRILPLSIVLTGLLSSVSFAQDFQSGLQTSQGLQTDIQTETLGAARAFDAGVLNTGDGSLGLDLGVALWQGTSSQRAVSLIEMAPIKPERTHLNHAIIRDMVRAALLSAGEPPQGEHEVFDAARLRAVMALGDEAALGTLMARNPVLAQSPTFRAERALAQNDNAAACDVSDQITQGRAEPIWARLRIVCHVLREETAAAELTRDLLQNSGYEDANYFALLAIMLRGKAPKTLPPAQASDDALIDFMRREVSQDEPGQTRIDKSIALDSAQAPDARLAALWANLEDMSANDITGLMSDIAFDANDIAGSSSFDLASASADSSPQGTGQLFLLSRTGNSEAVTAFIARAPEDVRNQLQDKMFEILPPPSAADMVALDLMGFTQKAIAGRDIGTLQSLYQALDGDARQARLALAADAVGNGFNFGVLGRDIDNRLADANDNRARRDAMLAMAMGAKMSDAAREALIGYSFKDGRRISDGDITILQQAVKAGSNAELVLLSAQLLDGPSLDTPSLSLIVQMLNSAGLPQFAGRIAAQDFMSNL